MTRVSGSAKRCAVYTRKSSDEGLEQDFNSLQAQREACEAFIKSQASEGWRLLRTAYDDGGFSGGNMERPALKRMLADIRERRIDVVVVYKVDRLTRSLADFAKIVELFDANEVSFVAVTQQFNTTTSMGRLTLNVLLSFAQFEREVTGERIRDKIAASKRKGMWMGGVTSLGYEVLQRKLIVNQVEAETVRDIFRRYLELKSVRMLKDDLDRRGIHSRVRLWKNGPRGGGAFSRGALYELLANPIYIGEIRHKEERFPGQHEAIVARDLWEEVQRLLRAQAARRGIASMRSDANILAGKLFDENGEPLYVCGTDKGGRRYRYYVSRRLLRGPGTEAREGWRLAAPEIERAVAVAVARILKDQATIGEVLHRSDVAPAEIEATLRAAEIRSKAIENAPQIETGAIASLVKRVELVKGGFTVSLSLEPFISQIKARPLNPAEMRLVRFIPLRLQRRGVETRLVLESEATQARQKDPALLKALARGFRWFKQLASGVATDTLEIAKREGVGDSYVRRLVPLALLAPEIVEAICAGRQPLPLSVEELTRMTDLPLDWREQQPLIRPD
jgi:site-specific DNA recombinase